MKEANKAAGIGDEAVQKRTGKSWSQWFALLDRAGAKAMSHKEIVAYLVEHHKIGPWWRQMLAVGYEQARGLREKHQKTDGFSAGVSRTFAVPVETLFRACQDRQWRESWLGASTNTIRKSTENKSLRIAWDDNKSNVEISFYAKGESKSQITIQHNQLANAQSVATMKTYWRTVLDALGSQLT